MERILEGKVAIVTGASQGLGLEIAGRFVDAGASVAICARDGAMLETSRERLQARCAAGQSIMATTADVSQSADVARFVDSTLERFRGIDILVNNAGVYGPMGLIEEVDWASWLRAVEINLFGSILMCKAVLPHLKARRYGKIVQLSGGGATNPLPRISAYAVSKAAVIRFIETLAEEVRPHHIDVNAIAPGALNTRLLDEVLAAGPDQVGEHFYDRSIEQKKKGGAPPDRAADLAVFLASSASDGITGKLISAIWDPWASFGEHLADLKDSDIYTLRRIVPADRNKTWGGEG